MRAIVLREHGGPEKLVLENDFPDPQAGPGEVVVRVRATSLNYHDVFTRRGMPGIKVPFPVIPGLDVAGEIASIGEDVEGWSVGDRVLIDPINRVEGGLTGETIYGGLAELCRTKTHQLVRIPAGVSYQEAAALPCAYGTALRMIQTNGSVTQGERVLILGASGGVGVACVQLSRRPFHQSRRTAQGSRRRSHHQLSRKGFCERNLRDLRQASPARSRSQTRRRRRCKLHGRRYVGQDTALFTCRRPLAYLRRNSGLRSTRGSEVHLDF